jgi:sorbitol/mannitol transport system substrate-binding protein
LHSLAILLTGANVPASKKPVTSQTVNNPAMIELQQLSTKFEADNPDITLNWVVVEENILRQGVTTDVPTGSGAVRLSFHRSL